VAKFQLAAPATCPVIQVSARLFGYSARMPLISLPTTSTIDPFAA
jgi:hypothetical protein